MEIIGIIADVATAITMVIALFALLTTVKNIRQRSCTIRGKNTDEEMIIRSKLRVRLSQ